MVHESSESQLLLPRPPIAATNSIAERRSHKAATKQRIQLPNIKDTRSDEEEEEEEKLLEDGEEDVASLLVSDITSNVDSDFGDRYKSAKSAGRSQILKLRDTKTITSTKNSDHQKSPLIRQQTCLVEPTNFFSQQANSTSTDHLMY